MSKAKKIIKSLAQAASNPKTANRRIAELKKIRHNHQRRRSSYIEWYKRNYPNDKLLAEQRANQKKLKTRPLISVVLPTYNTNPTHLKECLESVIAQTYGNWELCIADDASTREETKQVLRDYSKKYKNIKVVFSDINQHIAITSNLALKIAKGQFVSLLDHDDLLMPNALYETVQAINKNPSVDLIYSDEDKLEGDKHHVEPFFKPDWSPDFLNSCNYITHFATLSRRIIDEVEGFSIGTEGAQDWDLFLRVTKKTKEIHHIPKILYTWRKSVTSTAMSADSKPYAYTNQKKVLRRSIGLQKYTGSAHAHPSVGFWRAKYEIVGNPKVSIVIPTKDKLELIETCVESILNQSTYPNFEIVIVDTGSTDKKVKDFYKTIVSKNPEVKVVEKNGKFNYSKVCNYGVTKSSGDYILFLNNDTEVITHDWIQGLLEHAQRDEVGMVGAKLLFEDTTIQHTGVVLSDRDIAFHPFYGQSHSNDIFINIYVNNVRNCSAVTAACSMVSKKKFQELGGFDEKLRVTYNDVDLCLRLLDKGYVNVYNPFVELFHYESMSVGKISGNSRDMKELALASKTMKERWGNILKNDPFYNPNFEQHGPGYRLE